MRHKIGYISIFLFFIISIFLFNNTNKVDASISDNVFGYAWSSNIGWISFNNCVNPDDSSTCGQYNYGVKLNTNTMNVSGYAWSSNIGWISFNPSDWKECPPGATGCDNNNISNFNNKWGVGGWARVVSVIGKTNTGGWDGWISLGGLSPSYGAPFNFNQAFLLNNSNTEVLVIDTNSTGFWWGSEVVGWIDLRQANPGNINPDTNEIGVFVIAAPVGLALSASRNYTVAGNNVDITWEATNNFNPNSCERTSNPSVGSSWDTNSFEAVSVTKDIIEEVEVSHNNNSQSTQTEFKIECTDGLNTKIATVNVTATQFKPELYYPNACAVKTTTKQSINILNLEGADNPSCDIYANDSSNPNRFVGNVSASPVVDNNFNGLDTTYSMQCENSPSGNSASYTAKNILVKVCDPFFDISGDSRCGLTPQTQKYGDVFVKVGNDYVSQVELSINPYFGFNTEPVKVSSSDSNLIFTPSSFTINGGSEYNKITAQYVLDEASYIANTNNGEDVISTQITISPESKTPLILNFCPIGVTSGRIVPKYKPF